MPYGGDAVKIDCPERHNPLLLEFEAINKHILEFLSVVINIMNVPCGENFDTENGVGAVMKTSIFTVQIVLHVQE